MCCLFPLTGRCAKLFGGTAGLTIPRDIISRNRDPQPCLANVPLFPGVHNDGVVFVATLIRRF
jgi:hypothetical protein